MLTLIACALLSLLSGALAWVGTPRARVEMAATPVLAIDQWWWPTEVVECEQFLALEGATVWELARSHCSELVERYGMDLVVWAIAKANGGVAIQAGQFVWLPTTDSRTTQEGWRRKE